MKLRFSPTSPYVRKVLVSAIELGLAERIEKVPANPWDPDDTLPTVNPLGKVPALTTDDGLVLFDSVVICEYLDSHHDGRPLFPREPEERWRTLRLHALADGILDAAVTRLIEGARRPAEYRWPEWDARQKAKIDRALDSLEGEAASLDGPLDIGEVALGCALGYLDFRFAGEDWRSAHPKLAGWYEAFAERASMQATIPHEAS